MGKGVISLGKEKFVITAAPATAAAIRVAGTIEPAATPAAFLSESRPDGNSSQRRGPCQAGLDQGTEAGRGPGPRSQTRVKPCSVSRVPSVLCS